MDTVDECPLVPPTEEVHDGWKVLQTICLWLIKQISHHQPIDGGMALRLLVWGGHREREGTQGDHVGDGVVLSQRHLILAYVGRSGQAGLGVPRKR